MERRNFIKMVTASGAAVAFIGFEVSCRSENADPAYEGWNPEKLSNAADDFRLRILSYAMLAPNPHNKQPWKIKLVDDNSMLLYVDPERLLPMTDPFCRQIYIGQGTFLEMLDIAAKQFGYNPQIQWFPEGMDSVENTGKSPVAAITFVKMNAEKDKLFDYITKRVTNRLEYNDVQPDAGQLNLLKSIFDGKEYSIQFITDTGTTVALANLMTEAMKTETYLQRTHAETVAMIRFSDEEIAKYRDGFGYANMGLTGLTKFLAETFAGRNAAFSDSFKEKTVDATHKMTHSAKAFGILFSNENNRINQVEIGRKYARIHLTATQLGMAMHPMSQITQEYEELSFVRKKFAEITGSPNGTVQMVFRIGFADDVSHSPRRPVKDLFKS